MSKSDRLKVCFVTDASNVWGAEKSLIEIVQHLSSLVDVTVISAHGSPIREHLPPHVNMSDFQIQTRRRVRDAGGTSTSSKMDLVLDGLGSLRGGIQLSQALKSFDIVVCFGTWELLEVLTAARLARKPCALDLHETFTGGGGNVVLKFLSRFLSGVIATTAGVANSIHPSVKRCVVPRPVSLARYLPKPNHVRELNSVAIVGQVVPHKRVHKLLEAAENIDELTLSISIVGISPLEFRTPYERFVMGCAARSRHEVSFVEKTDHVAEHLKNARVIVNVSEHEAFGRTVIEGLAAGCFPIVSSGTGTEEVVLRAGVGWVVADVNLSLSEALQRYFLLPEATKDEMSSKATSAAQIYASDLVANQYLLALVKLGVRGAA